MDTNDMKAMLSCYRELQCEHGLLNSVPPTKDREPRIRALEQALTIVRALLGALSDEELFIVTRHIIDQLTWQFVVIEYEQKWGQMQARHERTLKRIQTNALQKMLDSIRRVGMEAEVQQVFASAFVQIPGP